MNASMNPPAGWYSDPEAPGHYRYWDGNLWTEHRAPAQPAPGAAGEDRGQAQPDPQQGRIAGDVADSDAGWQSPDGAASSPGGFSATAQFSADQDQSSHGETPIAQHQWEAPGPRSSKTVWIVAGIAFFVVLLIVLIIVMAIRLFNDSDTDSDTDSDSASEPEDAAGSQPDEVSAAEASTVTLELGASEEAEFQFELEEPGLVYIHTSSEAGVDPVLELQTADGTSIDEQDDGGADSSNALDAGFEALLVADEYTVVVSEFWGDAAEVDLTVDFSEEVEQIEPGEHSFSLEEDGSWLAGVEVAAGDTVTVDVRGPDGDPELTVLTPSGDIEHNDDRDATAPDSGSLWDPYLEVRADSAGVMLLEVTDYRSSAMDGQVSITVDE